MCIVSRFLFRHWLAVFLALSVPAVALTEPVATRRKQEVMHRPFLLKAADGKILATGEEVATVQGDFVHSRLTFRFSDGSLDDEETFFTQGAVFHLVSDHHIQKGPSFPDPMDILIDVPSGKITWHEQKFGKDTTKSQRLSLPNDLANGIMPLLVENFPPGCQEMKVSWLAIALKPLVVTLSVKPDGAQNVDPAGISERAYEYTLHVELHGMIGFLAPLVNKTPADIHIWVTDEKVPSFVRLVGPFYQDAPIWTVEPAGPVTP